MPAAATEFTPFAQQVKQANPDLLFVAWAGTTGPALWKALDQQGVLKSVAVTTGLAERATWPTFDPRGKDHLPVALRLGRAGQQDQRLAVKTMRHRGQVPDIFTPDGFVAAQMIVRAVQKAAAATSTR